MKQLAAKVIFYNVRFYFLKKYPMTKDIAYWTEYKSVRENKTRSEQLFKNKRNTLFRRDTVDKLEFDYNKVKEQFMLTKKLEKSAVELLKLQENTKAQLLNTLKNYKKVQVEVNRLKVFYQNGGKNSSDSNDKKSSLVMSSTNSVSFSNQSVSKKEARTGNLSSLIRQ